MVAITQVEYLRNHDAISLVDWQFGMMCLSFVICWTFGDGGGGEGYEGVEKHIVSKRKNDLN